MQYVNINMLADSNWSDFNWLNLATSPLVEVGAGVEVCGAGSTGKPWAVL